MPSRGPLANRCLSCELALWSNTLRRKIAQQLSNIVAGVGRKLLRGPTRCDHAASEVWACVLQTVGSGFSCSRGVSEHLVGSHLDGRRTQKQSHVGMGRISILVGVS